MDSEKKHGIRTFNFIIGDAMKFVYRLTIVGIKIKKKSIEFARLKFEQRCCAYSPPTKTRALNAFKRIKQSGAFETKHKKHVVAPLKILFDENPCRPEYKFSKSSGDFLTILGVSAGGMRNTIRNTSIFILLFKSTAIAERRGPC
uniref:Uncharacterized protein n=1 Tax=Glossina austeni TaxID=7395 RepID=A0A1A9UVM3_GLOAU